MWVNGICFILIADLSEYSEHDPSLKNWLFSLHDSENWTVTNVLSVLPDVVVSNVLSQTMSDSIYHCLNQNIIEETDQFARVGERWN